MKRKSVKGKRGFLNNKKLLRESYEPKTLQAVQSLAHRDLDDYCRRVTIDKIETKSLSGKSGPKLINFYKSSHVSSIVKSNGYSSHSTYPKNIKKLSENGIATLFIRGMYDSRANIETLGNGVRFGQYALNDKGAITLQGNDNAYDDTRFYSLGKSIFSQLKKILTYEERLSEFLFEEIFKNREHLITSPIKVNHRFVHYETFIVIDEFPSLKVCLDYFVKSIGDSFGDAYGRLNPDGDVQGEITYRFEDDERRGLVLKIYRFQEGLLKIEAMFKPDFFGATTRDYRFNGKGFSEVATYLNDMSSKVFHTILSSDEELDERVSYRECESLFMKVAPKYGREIISMFQAGNGYCYAKSTLAPHYYRSITKLVKAGLVYKQKKSRYLLPDNMKSLLQLREVHYEQK